MKAISKLEKLINFNLQIKGHLNHIKQVGTILGKLPTIVIVMYNLQKLMKFTKDYQK